MITKSLNGIITLVRGDDAIIPLEINVGTELYPEKYILSDNDYVYFGMMFPNQPFKDAVIRKKYSVDDVDESGNVIIRLDASDTECLPSGLYYYEAKLFRGDTQTTGTIVNKTIFYLID